MRNLFTAAKFLLLDLASTIVFMLVLAITHNVMLGIVMGMVLGVGQIGWALFTKRRADTMQWMSLFLVLAGGAASLLTHDPRFVMFKPTIIYAIVGVVMLKPGWMNRYLPPIAQKTAGDLAVIFGFVWSGLMFASAALNLVLVFRLSPEAWAQTMSVWGIASKIGLFLVQYATMRIVGGRRGHLLTEQEIADYRAGRVDMSASSAAAPAAGAPSA
jgi:intracellular septation protein A